MIYLSRVTGSLPIWLGLLYLKMPVGAQPLVPGITERKPGLSTLYFRIFILPLLHDFIPAKASNRLHALHYSKLLRIHDVPI